MWALDKEETDSFFTKAGDLKNQIHKITLNFEVNKDLKLLGEKTGKKLSAHSYRITLVTKVNDESGIYVANKIRGYKNI